MTATILLTLVLLSIPVLNTQVFKIENLSTKRQDIARRFEEIGNYAASGDRKAEEASLDALIKKYENNKDNVSQTAVQLAMFTQASRGQQTAFTIDDFQRAIKDCNDLLKKYPNTMVAEQLFMIAAKCHISMADQGSDEKNNYQKAIDFLERIEKNRPEAFNFPKYKFTELKPGQYFNIDRGKAVLKNKDLVKSLYTLKDAIREQATDTTQTKAELLSDAVMEIGHCLSKMAEGEKAREQYSIIINIFKESDLVDNAAKAIADSYVKEADILEAKIAVSSDSSVIADLRAKQQKLYLSASESYQKFINIYIQSDLLSKATIALGGVYFKLKNNEDAYATFAKAINSIKVIEEQAKVQLDIGNYYYGEKKWDDAIENYAKVLQNYSATEFAANAQFLLGDCHEAKGDTAAAVKAYETVIEEFRNSRFYPASASKLSEVYLGKKDYTRAQQLLRQSVSRYPESNVAAQSQYKIGLIYMELADADSAKGVEKSQLDLKYKLAIKEFETVLGQYDRAKEWVEKAVLEIGRCQMKLGNKDEARKALDGLQSQQLMVEKYRILGVAGSDSSIIGDFYEQLSKLTEPQAQAVQYIEIGRRLAGEQMNLLDSALAVYRLAVSLTTNNTTKMTAYGEIGNVYMAKGEYRKARQLYEDEVLENPDCEMERRVQFEFKVADTYFRDKNYAEAEKAYAAFVDKYPDNKIFTPPALFTLGKSKASLGDHAGAKADYQRLFDQFEKSDLIDNGVLSYGEALQAEGKPQDAVTYILKHIKKVPGSQSMPSLYFKVADLYKSALNNPDSAIFYYGKVLNFSDHFLYSAAGYNSGRLYAAAGNDAKAIESYSKVKKTDIEYFRAAQGDIGALKAKTDPAGAIKNYEDIESSSPEVDDKITARMGIGDVLVAQKKFSDAVASYRTIVDKYIGTTTTLREVAVIKIIDALNNESKYGEIISWADRMIREFPQSKYAVNAYYFKANALNMLKRYRESRDVFKIVMEKDSVGNLAEVSQYQRAECLMSMQEPTTAIKEYNAFIQKYPKSQLVANALFSTANYEYGQENYEKAKGIYTRMLGEFPNFSAVCWVKNYLAFCYDKEGSWQKAKRIYSEVKDAACDKDSKTFAKEQIQAIYVKH
ncbi:MAG: tetratricopeptide repeat protein [Fibrobacteres bacterium]|nr:tetratricopeptide repeat protein [Fibrobacterota bacterium]